MVVNFMHVCNFYLSKLFLVFYCYKLYYSKYAHMHSCILWKDICLEILSYGQYTQFTFP